jgi:hypothetical protein
LGPEPVNTPRRISLAPVENQTLFLESSPSGLLAIPAQLQTSVGPVVQLYSWRRVKPCGENKYLISLLSCFSLLTSEILSAWAGDKARLGQYLKLREKKRTWSGLVDAPASAFRRIYVSYLAFDLPLHHSARMP